MWSVPSIGVQVRPIASPNAKMRSVPASITWPAALAELLWCYEWIDASEQFEQSGPTGMKRIGCVGGGVGRAASFES